MGKRVCRVYVGCMASRLNFCLSASSSMQSGGRADWQECPDVCLRSLHLLPGVAGHNDQVAPVSVLCIQVDKILHLPPDSSLVSSTVSARCLLPRPWPSLCWSFSLALSWFLPSIVVLWSSSTSLCSVLHSPTPNHASEEGEGGG